MSRLIIFGAGDIARLAHYYFTRDTALGYAESVNGVDWRREDEEVGIGVSSTGWDSEMIEYPFVFDHDNRQFMLYKLNGYGKTGVGLAVLEG